MQSAQPPLTIPSGQSFRLFPKLVGAVALLYAAVFAYFIWRTAGQMSGYDFLDWIMQYGDGPKDWFTYLWTPHNEHRIAADRLLVAIDIDWFGGTTLPFVVVRTLLLVTMTIALMRQVQNSEFATTAKITVISFLVFALLPANLVVMCSMPVMGGFIHTATFATFALLLWDNNSTPRQLAALTAAAVAGFGVAGGLLIWPVLVFYVWRSGARTILVTMVAVTAVLMWVLYLRDLPSQQGLLSLQPARLLAVADFVVRFLGLPWAHSAALVWPGRVIGLLVLVAGCYLVVTDAVWQTRKSRLERLGLGMIQFAFLSAAAAALSRWNMAPDREMPVRYAAIVALAHAGLLLAASHWVGNLLTGRNSAVVKIGLVGIALALFAQQLLVGRAAAVEAGLYSDAWARFSAGAWTPDMTHYVHPDRARAEQVLAFMKARHIYGQ